MRNGWKQIYWGTKDHWEEVYLKTPMWQGPPGTSWVASAVGTNPGVNTPLKLPGGISMHPYFPKDVPSTGDYPVGLNALLHVVHTISVHVANNQEYPIYLTAYKWVAKEGGDNTNHLPLDAMDQAITEMEHFGLDTETQNKENILFSMKDLDKTNTLNSIWKSKGRTKVKLNPGDLAKISITNNFKIRIQDYVNFSSTWGGSFLAGRIHCLMFKLQGPLGKVDVTPYTGAIPDNQPGYLGANAQMAIKQTWKSRFENTTIPRIFSWENPQEAAVPIADNQFATDALKSVYPNATDGTEG
jgi:hypothetical protein